MKAKFLLFVLCCLSLFQISESYAKRGNSQTTFKNWKALGYKSENDQMHLYEIGTIEWELMAEKIGESKYVEKLQNCLEKNPFCSGMLGKYYLGNGDYSRAYKLLSTYYVDLNKYTVDPYRGDVEFALGTMFDNGFGVLQNKDKAIEHYKICASLGDKECAFNMSIDYASKIRESNEYNTQISNVMESYAWLQVSRALGKTKITRKDGKIEDISVLLESQREKIGKLNVLTEANKLAIQICSTIPKCIQ